MDMSSQLLLFLKIRRHLDFQEGKNELDLQYNAD